MVKAAAVAAVVAAGTIAVRAWSPAAPPSLVATGQLAKRDRVIIADFQNHTRDSLLAGIVS